MVQAAKRRRSISSDGSSVPIHRLPAALHSCHSQHSLKGHANLSRSSTPSGPHSLGKHVLTYRCPFGPPSPARARARPGPAQQLSGPCRPMAWFPNLHSINSKKNCIQKTCNRIQNQNFRTNRKQGTKISKRSSLLSLASDDTNYTSVYT